MDAPLTPPEAAPAPDGGAGHGSAQAPAAAVTSPATVALARQERDEQLLFESIEGLLELPGEQITDALQQRLQQAEAGGRVVEQAFVRLMMARHRGLDGRPEEAFELCRQAQAELQRAGTESARAAGLLVQGGLQALRGDYDAALELLGPVLSLARALGWRALLASALSNLSIVQLGTGSLPQAVASLDEAAQLVGEGERRLHRVVRGNLALTLVKWAREQRDQGLDPQQWRPGAERALHLMRRQTAALEHPAQTEDRVMRYAFGCKAAALVMLDELPEACSLLLQLRPLYEAAGDARAVLFVDTELTRAALQAGRPDEAVQRARQGIAQAEAARHTGEIDELYRLLADALEATGDHRSALQAHRSYHRLHKEKVLEKALHRTRALAVALETERARRESRLDPLTGLGNRRAFDEALARLLSQATSAAPVALALLDLDHFKRVNDRHGHADGDAALLLLADLLQSHPRPGDLAARLGGDEFVLLLPGDAQAAASLCQRLRAALRQASLQRWPGREPLTLSVGIAAADAPMAPQELLARADRVLYAVKAAGRDAQAVG